MEKGEGVASQLGGIGRAKKRALGLFHGDCGGCSRKMIGHVKDRSFQKELKEWGVG